MQDDRLATGIEGLDDILGGGLPPGRLYLVQGDPGSGKTTLGLQFLLEGERRGERGLYVTLSETREELISVARSHGMDVDKLSLFDLGSSGVQLDAEAQNTLFEPAEVELNELSEALLAKVAEAKPVRLVFDSLSELRLLAQSALRYRRQVLMLKQRLAVLGCTVLVTDDRTSETGDLQLQSLAHGVLVLDQLSPLYGAERRRLRVLKMRGVSYRGGYHDFRINKGGIELFPRLVAAEHRSRFSPEQVKSGLPGLDDLLGGGLDRGTSALFLGPAGCGKSALTMQYAVTAAARGETAAVYAFDEGLGTLAARTEALGLPFSEQLASGKLRVQQVDPAEMSPGEFVHLVRRDVEQHNARVVVIDSLNGYLNAMPEEQFLTVQLHEVLSYLRQRGVLVILVVAQSGMMGAMNSPVDVSYLADTVLVLRYFEAMGRVRKALSVLKRRSGKHGQDIRELRMDAAGIHIGEPLEQFQGVFTGVPTLVQSRA
jgi:circadian clock protein KaiC